MNWRDYIHSDANVLAGKPVIKGTRLSVDLIVGRMADGWSLEDILYNYPTLTAESLQAVFAYTHELLQDTSFYVPPVKDAA